MQHLQYGINFLSKFAIARRLPLLRGTLRHIIIPCLILEDCQARKLNKEDAMDRCKWRKMIKEAR